MSYRPSAGSWGEKRFYKSEAHYRAALASRDDVRSFTGAIIKIDTREIEKLALAFKEIGVGSRRTASIMSQSLNRSGARVVTQVKRSLQRWTGIRRQAELTKRIRRVYASPAKLEAGVFVSGRHLRITKADFGARWQRSLPGVRHSAWQGGNLERGAFMPARFRGGSSYGGGLAFKRIGGRRTPAPDYSEMPIQPLYGPHPAREMERHSTEVRVIVEREGRLFLEEATRRVGVELQRMKAKYGL